jgi:hypothetical protein
MTTVPFVYSPITERPPLTRPGGARLAVYVGLNIEYFHPRTADRGETTTGWAGGATSRRSTLRCW